MGFKAIETEYRGRRFRSRLEARWAVFLDALGLRWEYEPEGFEFDGLRYLPDFHVAEIGWLEIKPLKEPTQDELKKCSAFATNIETMYMLCGEPKLPKVETGKPSDPLLYRIKHGSPFAMMFGKVENADPPHSIIDSRPHWWHQRIEDGSFCLWPIPSFEIVKEQDADFHLVISDSSIVPVVAPFTRKKIDTQPLITAYRAALSARFEFGENGYRQPRKVWPGTDWGKPAYGELPY